MTRKSQTKAAAVFNEDEQTEDEFSPKEGGLKENLLGRGIHDDWFNVF